MAKLELLLQLKEEAKQCQKCELYKTRTNVVFGDGNIDAKLLFVGEAGGYHEDKQGHCFVGAAGKVLDTLLGLAGIKREDIYICNVLKCRPPKNRDPTPQEIEACFYYLKQQINIIQPKLIVTLGRVAASTLLGRPISISKIHGQLVDCEYCGWKGKLYLMYHPAAMIYNQKLKGLIEEDFRKLQSIVKNLFKLPRRELFPSQ